MEDRLALQLLRSVCKGYPRSDVLHAVEIGLIGSGVDQAERSGLGALVTAWLLDDDASTPPPLTAQTAEAILRELSKRAH